MPAMSEQGRTGRGGAAQRLELGGAVGGGVLGDGAVARGVGDAAELVALLEGAAQPARQEA